MNNSLASIDTENKLLRGWVRKVKGNERYKLPVIKSVSHGGVMYSRGNIVSSIEIPVQ